ncbi:MAG: hypothetical protein DMF54_07820 [Acidobacteria bacterium]|nr:MAG: hypothetical protein DMF55_03830 [Acidobacteriota bacterium]PYQ66447.1 MAG: hypothetical protein DMF54_07820 [Acidobacteriota bacterium]
MRSRTILAAAVVTGLVLSPRCARVSRYETRSAARPMPAAAETAPSYAAEKASAAAGPDLAAKPAEVGSAAKSAEVGSAAKSADTGSPAISRSAADPFTTTVRPILSARCGACHDPGGKMYARLPFDDSRVVGSHPEGVLRRLKGGDRAALEKWFASLPAEIRKD